MAKSSGSKGGQNGGRNDNFYASDFCPSCGYSLHSCGGDLKEPEISDIIITECKNPLCSWSLITAVKILDQ